MSLFDNNKPKSGLMEVGAVWQRKSKGGKDYQAISFKPEITVETLEQGRELQIWPLEQKSDKHPVGRLMLAPEKEEKETEEEETEEAK